MEYAFERRIWLFDGAQVRLPTQLAFVVEDAKLKEGKKKTADVWEVQTVFISGGWLEVTQVEPPLLPYTFRSSHVNPTQIRRKANTLRMSRSNHEISYPMMPHYATGRGVWTQRHSRTFSIQGPRSIA